MLLTALEIIAFMVAASIIGVILGWVLRGSLGREQVEISELRTQLRQMKKANRESKAALAATSGATTETGTVKAAEKPETAKATETKVSAKKAPAKPAGKAPAKKKGAKKSTKKASPRKTQAEREADQAAGAKAFADVVDRIGISDEQDNLTKIYGVGKKYAGMLNNLGISSYQQIATLRKADIRTLAAALGVLDDRLEKEDWVGNAKVLLKQAKK